MTASIGRGLVLLSLLCASAGAVAAFAAFLKKRADLTTIAVRASYGFALSMFLANVWMVAGLLRDYFSISYVAQVGSTSLPTWVKVVTLWSSLEGSILFWGGVLAIYVAVVGALSAVFGSQSSLLFSLVATGLVAVALPPLRERVQRAANRLVYGERD